MTFQEVINSIWDRPAGYAASHHSLFPLFVFMMGVLVGLFIGMLVAQWEFDRLTGSP